mmetsp:Transcript_65444/g.164919  ORF Transcript_65444/g.164919 Transcript_65444/m.164919 type:complete len:688 (+) Transcript_65444:94-2157(+)
MVLAFVQGLVGPLPLPLPLPTPPSTPRLQPPPSPRGIGKDPPSPRAGTSGTPSAASAARAPTAAAAAIAMGALGSRRARRPSAAGSVSGSAVVVRVTTLEKPEVETKADHEQSQKSALSDADPDQTQKSGLSDEYYETANKIFQFIDSNGNGSIDRVELTAALNMLREEGNVELNEDEDAFFFRYASGSGVEWQQAALEWFDKALEDEVKKYGRRADLQRDQAFTRKEYNEFIEEVESVFKVGITPSDVQAGWEDLQRNYEKKKTVAEFTSSARSVFADRISDAVARIFAEVDGEGKTNKLIDYGEIQEATKLLNERHGLGVSEEDTLLFMRIFGGIREDEWREGAAGLLNAGGSDGSIDLIAGFLKKDPELSDGTLPNGVPKQAAYGFQEWARAQDQSRYLKSLLVLATPASSSRRIGPPLTTIFAISVVTVVYNDFVAKSLGLPLLTLPTELFSLSAASLGLLLVFRTNGSYSRFVEARKIWGDTLNRCRDLTRQAAWIGNELDRDDFFRYIPAFATALKCLLRPPDRHDLAQEASTHLKQREVREMLTSGLPPPCWVLYRMATIGDTIAKDGQHQKHQLMSENISELIANVGKCERILSTPMPATYTRLSTRFLLVWLGLLPMMLYLKIGLSAVFATFVMAFFLLGIEDLGCQIEEPFSVLPLTRISNKIAAEASVVLNLKQKW